MADKGNKTSNIRKEDIERMVLEAYFSIRNPLGTDRELYVEDDKTTTLIQDDLRDTLLIDDSTIVHFMLEHGYMLTLAADGSPVWRIYRLR